MTNETDEEETAARKIRAREWFAGLRTNICREFEVLEARAAQELGPSDKHQKFTLRETRRNAETGSDAGGGLMSILAKGQVFEKVGVNISEVYGTLSPALQASLVSRGQLEEVPGASKFWASGISLVAHLQNPHVPAVHFNTRMFWTPSGSWFGGGSDLNPCIEYEEDTIHFHSVLKKACDKHDRGSYRKFKEWADEYFYISHRKKCRGVGGIFFDYLNSGDWEQDFSFVKDVGRAFLPSYLPILNRRRKQGWTDADREYQLVQRGHYAEFNLVYDRGTQFGLQSGHDPDAVLMSLPPVAKWP